MIQGIARERDAGVVLSSHLLTEIEGICDDVVIMNAGQIVAKGSVEEVLGQAGATAARGTSCAYAYPPRPSTPPQRSSTGLPGRRPLIATPTAGSRSRSMRPMGCVDRRRAEPPARRPDPSRRPDPGVRGRGWPATGRLPAAHRGGDRMTAATSPMSAAEATARSDRPVWWLVFRQELDDLWVGGKALNLLILFGILMSITAFLLATNSELSLTPPRLMIVVMIQSAITFGLFIGLVIASESVSGERERATLEPLLLAPAGRRQIILGKYLAALSPWPIAYAYCMPYVITLSPGRPRRVAGAGLGRAPRHPRDRRVHGARRARQHVVEQQPDQSVRRPAHLHPGAAAGQPARRVQ